MKKLAVTLMVGTLLTTTVATPLISVQTVFAQETQTNVKSSLDILNERVTEFPQATRVSQLNTTQLQELKSILLTNFEQKAVQLAKEDYVTKVTRLDTAGLSKYFTPLVTKIRRENPNLTPQEASAKAMQLAIEAANKDLYVDVVWQALIDDVKQLFTQLLDSQLLTSNSQLTIAKLKFDMHQLHRGLFYLVQNFNFQSGLPKQLVLNPEQFGKIAAAKTAYDRLIDYGTTTRKTTNAQTNKSIIDNFVKLITGVKQYDERIRVYTGVDIFGLIDVLANRSGLSSSEYFTRYTKALLAKSDKVTDVYSTLKEKFPTYVLPILSNGSDVYAGLTTHGLNIGRVSTYLGDYPVLRQYQAVSGQVKTTYTAFRDILNQQENYWSFMQTTTTGEIKPMVAVDTMYQYDINTNKLVWGTDTTSVAVRDFFTPMSLMPANAPTGGGLPVAGYSDSETMFHAVGDRLMNPNKTGLTLFSHETTHSKERNLFGVKRAGQGPEVYARGLFEDIDNTQGGVSSYRPVFTLNTTIDVGNKDNRTQRVNAHTSKESLQNYAKHLMDLVAYMEVVEASVVLALPNADKTAYFNKVNQISAENDTNRRNAGSHLTSTNDEFVANGITATTIEELVKQNAVSGQFIPKGTSPVVTIRHNDYVNVPMLSSFYAAPQQMDASKNTVGDVSFKRIAHEVLAWKGWTAFTNYIGNGSTSDSQAFATILNGEAENVWANFKAQKYNDLISNYKINPAIVGTFNEDIKTAIQQDLVVIKAFQKEVAPILANTSLSADQKQAQIVQKATQTGVYTRAVNVSNVKAALLERALKFNELNTSVLVKKQEPVDTSSLQAEVNKESDVKESVAYVNAENRLQEAYRTKLTEAKAILGQGNPTQEAVNNALTALQQAREALNGVLANKQPLQNEVAKENDVKVSIAYVNAKDELKRAYDDKVKEANALLTEANPSEQRLAQALQALQNAREALNGVLVDKAALENEIGKANDVKADVTYINADKQLQEDYDTKLAEAKLVLEQENPAQDAVNNARSALETARTALNGELIYGKDNAVFNGWKQLADNKWYNIKNGVIDTTVTPYENEAVSKMYRLYDKKNNLHFYTIHLSEVRLLQSRGWIYEGVAWLSVNDASGTPVYRVWNKQTGERLFTRHQSELIKFIARGWVNEGIAFRMPSSGHAIYRLVNKQTGRYVLSAGKDEVTKLVNTGLWINEGIAFFALSR